MLPLVLNADHWGTGTGRAGGRADTDPPCLYLGSTPGATTALPGAAAATPPRPELTTWKAWADHYAARKPSYSPQAAAGLTVRIG